MLSFFAARAVKPFLCLLLIGLLLVGCDLPGQGGGAVSITVGTKSDIEGQLLSKIYVLLLQHAGFTVQEHNEAKDDSEIFAEIKQGTIDLYPEFTVSGLQRLKVAASGDAVQDYQTVKQGYEKNYHITWLDEASSLIDSYGLCTTKTLASAHHLISISDLSTVAGQLGIATPQDTTSSSTLLRAVEDKYRFSFGNQQSVSEDQAFQSVADGQVQVSLCHVTNPLIEQDNFVILQDDMNAFPKSYPAPIVRDETLNNAPTLTSVLHPLASLLTSEVSTMLQEEVLGGFALDNVARSWLESQKLL